MKQKSGPDKAPAEQVPLILTSTTHAAISVHCRAEDASALRDLTHPKAGKCVSHNRNMNSTESVLHTSLLKAAGLYPCPDVRRGIAFKPQ